ncbi:MAG: high-affinity branched-chain amino acid ABC transporter permease LivM [Pseudomonadota bacterium]|nr:high-affinity branched-chain amino acid ABC transporter permease LivM [Pseudomonadota bacterium]
MRAQSPIPRFRIGQTEIDVAAALKESGLAALVALGLSVIIVGIRIVDVKGGLSFDTRFMWVGIAVAGVFAGRFVLAARRQITRPKASERREDIADNIGAGVQLFSKYAAPVLIAFAIALPFMPFANRYIVDVATLVMTYIMLGWGLNIVVGLAGLLDLGYVAFYAIGAYSFALAAQHLQWGFWGSLPVAGAFAACFGIVLGFPVLRLRGDYLAIVTLAFGEMVRVILINWYPVTKGPDGLSGIPRPSFFGLPFMRRPPEGVETFHMYFGLEYASLHRIIFLYYVILAMALVTNVFTLRIRKLPIGRAWEALREDEIASRSLGINPTNTKLTAFAIGAMFGGFAGSFFATRQGFISPESFTFVESAVILAIVVLGGMGSQMGVVVASVLLIGGTELLRELDEYRMLVFGAAMVGIMIWRPRGLLAHREPTLRLNPKPGRKRRRA